LFSILKSIRDRTLEKYASLTAVFDKEPRNEDMKLNLKETINQLENQITKRNEEFSSEINNLALEKLEKELLANLNSILKEGPIEDKDRLDRYLNSFVKATKNYDHEAKGVEKCKVFVLRAGEFNNEALKKIA